MEYKILQEAQASSLQNRIQHFSTKIQLRGGTDAIHQGLLVEVSAAFYAKVEELFEKQVKSIAKSDDEAQLIIKTDKMESYISTPRRRVNDLTPDHLLAAIQKSQNSGLTIKFSDNLVLEFLHIRRDKGWDLLGGARRPDLKYFNGHFQKKSCRTVTKVGQNTCLLACCIVGEAHERMIAARVLKDEGKITEATKKYRQLADHVGKNKILDSAVKDLYEKAGIPQGRPCDLTHLSVFEQILGVSFKVISIPQQLKIVYKGPTNPTRAYVYLLYSNPNGAHVGHYDLVTNIKGFHAKHRYCLECDVPYSNIYDHRCPGSANNFCFSCYAPDCKRSQDDKKCDTCQMKLNSPKCEILHKSKHCADRWVCKTCFKRVFRKKIFDPVYKVKRLQTNEDMELQHDCGKYTCRDCAEEVDLDHRCYVKRKPYRTKLQKLLFFDVETDQSSKKHIVNHIHAKFYQQTAEEEQDFDDMHMKKCILERHTKDIKAMQKKLDNSLVADQDKEDYDQEIERMKDQVEEFSKLLKEYDRYLANDEKWKGKWVEKSYSGEGSILEFCSDLSKTFRGYTCIAHNLKGFDGVFILKTFLENGITPEVICKGMKLLEIRVSEFDLRFIDSFNFLPMGLAKLPGAFGLECQKGYFPHFFNIPGNKEYVGPYPKPKFYGVSQMSTAQRQSFYIWHRAQDGKTFNFKEELKHYCAEDVNVLYQACMAYRKLMCATSNVDPFAYVTLASVCSAVYRRMFMPEKSIGRVPPSGYDGAKYSNEAYEWLEYLRNHVGISNLRHAMNGGEKRIKQYFVDGFDNESNTVYEYYGCFWHGCQKCFKETVRNPDTCERLKKVYTRTKIREQEIRDLGYKVETIWACEWTRQKNDNPCLAKEVKDMNISTPLIPNEAFFGGRTECLRVYTNRGPIVYHDVTSLYPWVNSSMKYPLGHPEIILSDFKDISNYFGIVKCQMLAPQDLFLPVLPIHAGPTRKLVFPLCRTCGANFQQTTCDHNEQDRILTGTWFSEELKLAVEKGYKLVKIFSIWHFPVTTTELFAPYIRTFYKLKLLSSKLPYNTPEQIEGFMKQVAEKEKIEIKDASEFRENPGLRQITKLMLNNLWGRFGMSANMSKTIFVTTFADLEKILEDPLKEVQSLRIINEQITQVVWRASENEFLACSTDTNIFVALVTTGWARIRLYQEMDKLKERVLYCDTDSVIYEESTRSEENLQVGTFLGDMTSELDTDDHIVEFVSGGPKNYGYVTKNNKTVVKIKGFTLNSTNAPAFSFQNLKRVILRGADDKLEPAAKRRCMMTVRENFLDRHLEKAEEASAFADELGISVYNPVKIARTRTWEILQVAEQKVYTFQNDKRLIDPRNHKTTPYGYG